MKIRLDDLTHPKVIALLEEHLQDMHAVSPPESIHALDLAGLRQPEMRFWSMWHGDELAGCVALKQHDAQLGEIKSMRTSRAFHRQGIGSQLLTHVIEQANALQLTQLSLETGIEDYFAPARALYRKFGFTECAPFAQYKLDPNSVFMTLLL
ncbi:GNAT family N-acetyltransferase [Alteromonas sp. a30]|uniref:GNAT family N-acetyltransferase n=1 Tax=Alteromonas sp. a30 TaxID=2730917 RepID=UPI0022807A6F|nr:GNAT family N-acetyltransferase [Alteromonas sp. a30]MCY7294970.1 GNAT family N-acetyltransferase [Alteromonas sp. a30]